jgi:hypothetical protein
MRVLLDECLPKRLGRELAGHQVQTVPQMGWAATKNGALLREAASAFDVFLTMDKNLVYQQNLSQYKTLSVIALRARSNKLDILRPLVPDILAVLTTIKPGEFQRITDRLR